jgi:hypothetical protein
VNHGNYTTYTSGCRCTECKAAMAAYQRSYKAHKLAERVLVDGFLMHPRAPHGTSGGHSNWGCSCAPCREAWAAECRRMKANRAAKSFEFEGRRIVPDAPHGTDNGYGNYGCRCRECTDQWTRSTSKRARRRKSAA